MSDIVDEALDLRVRAERLARERLERELREAER